MNDDGLRVAAFLLTRMDRLRGYVGQAHRAERLGWAVERIAVAWATQYGEQAEREANVVIASSKSIGTIL